MQKKRKRLPVMVGFLRRLFDYETIDFQNISKLLNYLLGVNGFPKLLLLLPPTQFNQGAQLSSAYWADCYRLKL